MPKPFKLSAQPSDAGIGRLPDGKFVRLEAPSPPKIREEAMAEGETVTEVLRERRVPHHPVGSETPRETQPNQRMGPSETGGHPQAPVYEDSIPWPKAGPTNDADKPPMRLKNL